MSFNLQLPLHNVQLKVDVNIARYGYGGLPAGMHMPVSRYKGPFTPSQWMELEHQALIYKHFVANVPVPSHLLNPLRKSLNTFLFPGSSSSTSYAPNSCTYNQLVSFVLS
ncbi:putative transcription factor interactor and regulator C3H-WRC/GRF family [Helianthus debilis subsp. tardiflorus]